MLDLTNNLSDKKFCFTQKDQPTIIQHFYYANLLYLIENIFNRNENKDIYIYMKRISFLSTSKKY